MYHNTLYSVKYYNIIQNYVDNLLKEAKKYNKLVECISSFNGLSLYRTSKFLNTYYDGRIRLDLVPKANLDAHKNITKSMLKK